MNDKPESKPENKTQLPFFATAQGEKPMTSRTGLRAGREAALKAGGG